MNIRRMVVSVVVFMVVLVFSNYVVWADNPQDIFTNIALTATGTASSEYNASFVATKINDGIMNRWNEGEWASLGEGAGAWVQLTWTSAVTINQVQIYSRPNRYDIVYDSYLLIDSDNDGECDDYSIRVGMQGQGGVPKIVNLTSTEGATVYRLRFRVDEVSANTYNTGLAEIECYNIMGDDNTSIGNQALRSNTTGICNTAAGYYALYLNTTGGSNTAAGYYALRYNTSGDYNTATGANALRNNITGYGNTATGVTALSANSSGYYNTAAGYNALTANLSGYSNTAVGYSALLNNTTSYSNTAVGSEALRTNSSTGNGNTAIGYTALYSNLSGDSNVAVGYDALYTNSTGDGNVAIGVDAGYSATGSSKLYIDNSSTDTPLIYGDFSTDRVGINTTSLSYPLEVGGTIRTGMNGRDGQLRIYSEQNGTDYEVLFQPHATMTQNTTYTLPANDGDATQVLTTDGIGNLSWGAKAFIINHPIYEDKLLVHACLEGPENGVYYRGIVTIDEPNKVLEIKLPSYFEYLVRKEDRTILANVIEDYENFSPNQPPWVKVSTIKDGIFKIASSAPCRVSWEVKGVRRDLGKLPVEIGKDDYLNNKYPELERRDITKFKDIPLWE